MKYNELPIEYLPSAEEVLLVNQLMTSPNWEHHPYMPVVKGDKIEVYRARYISKERTDRRRYWMEKELPLLVVESDAWWLDNERTTLAVRCKWQDKEGDVWWKKNSGTIWFYRKVDGEWIKLKVNKQDIAELIERIRTLQELDW
jgi:hypothetical protein